MKKIGVLGGCVTRDIFRVTGTDEEVGFFCGRTCVPSILSGPVNELEYDCGFEPGSWEERQSFIDANKTFFDALRFCRPETLIVDFMSEMYPLARRGDGLATLGPDTGRRARELGLELGLELDVIAPYSAARRDMLVATLPEFLDRVRSSGVSRILIHACYHSRLQRGAAGPVRVDARARAEAGKANAHLAFIYAFLEQHARQIELFSGEPESAIADPGHIWGPSPIHYEDAYARSARTALLDLRESLHQGQMTATG